MCLWAIGQVQLVTFPNPNNWQHISGVSELHMHVNRFQWPQLKSDCGELDYCGFHSLETAESSWLYKQYKSVGPDFIVNSLQHITYLIMKAQCVSQDIFV